MHIIYGVDHSVEPAQVDVDVPLPPPDISGSIPGGAGRGPVGVPVGGNVTLFCPTTGVDLPTTRWEINGVAVVSMPPRIVVGSRNVNGQIFLTLTITNISASDQITYTCVTMNADGTDRQDVIVRGKLLYELMKECVLFYTEPPRNEWCLGTWSTVCFFFLIVLFSFFCYSALQIAIVVHATEQWSAKTMPEEYSLT